MKMDEFNRSFKKNGFEISVDYFDTFPKRIQERINDKKGEVFNGWSILLKPQVYVALFLIMVMATLVLLNRQEQKKELIAISLKKDSTISAEDNLIVENIDKEEIKDYYIKNIKVNDLEEITRVEDTILIVNSYLSENTIEVDEIIELDIDEELIIEELSKN